MKESIHNRVVVTGMGIISPNALGLDEFERSIKNGVSGIELIPELKELGLKCQVAGIPNDVIAYSENKIPQYMRTKIQSSVLLYGVLAGLEAWEDAGLKINENVDWEGGVIMGLQTVDGNFAKEVIDKIYNEGIRKLNGRMAEQSITSSLSSYLSGYLGLGNCSISNSSACATGTESIYMAYQKIKNGNAKRILAGSSESCSPFIWSTLDRVRVLNSSSNEKPTAASKPMSADAAGIVPACGAGALVLENLTSAIDRGATIYAEIIGGANNCGGQREGGSMTNPNPEGIKRCIQSAITDAEISPSQIDLISGHLTGTHADSIEIKAWSTFYKNAEQFPYINALKSMIGHSLGAAGSIESIASVLQLYNGFVHPTLNCDKIHPEVEKFVNKDRILSAVKNECLSHVAKANFGFGDVNTCIIYKKYIKNE